MLTEQQIDNIQILTQRSVQKLTDWIISDICRRIAEAGTLTSTAEYQIWRLKKLGVQKKTINAEIKKRTGLTKNELLELVKESAKQGYQMDLKRLGAEAEAFEDNEELQQILQAAVNLADANFENITNTLGFVMSNGRAVNLTKAYRQACDFAQMQTASGAVDYATAIKNATKSLVNYGVQSIDYASGRSRSVEAAVRGSVMGGIGLMQEQISEHNHKELNANGWELSAHAMSAPDHEPYQGRQFTDKQYTELQNRLRRRIGTLNCMHIAFPIILGISKPMYSKEQLEQFKKDNAKGINYQGKHYTLYKATQMQRQIERSIRAQKRRILASEAIYKASGNDIPLKADKAKLTLLQQEYNNFSKAAGLKPQYARFDMGVNVR